MWTPDDINNKNTDETKSSGMKGVLIYDEFGHPLAILEPPLPSKKPRIGFGASLYLDNGKMKGEK